MSVEERLDRLERENRRLKVVGLILVMIFASVFVMGQARPVTYVGDMFTLARPAGGVAGLLWTIDGRPALILFDSAVDSSDRATIGILEQDVASVWVRGSGNRGLASMDANRD